MTLLEKRATAEELAHKLRERNERLGRKPSLADRWRDWRLARQMAQFEFGPVLRAYYREQR